MRKYWSSLNSKKFGLQLQFSKKLKPEENICTWEVISKWKRSWARAVTNVDSRHTFWYPCDSKSSSVVGLHHCPHKNLKTNILEFQREADPHTVTLTLTLTQRSWWWWSLKTFLFYWLRLKKERGFGSWFSQGNFYLTKREKG